MDTEAVKQLANDVNNVMSATAKPYQKQIQRLQADIERFRKRDGNATIELCFEKGDDPFCRETLKHIDFGVSDNIYVVESAELTQLQAENKDLAKKLNEARTVNAELGIGIQAVDALMERDSAQAENKKLKKVAIDVADDLRYLTQEGRSSVPRWIVNRVLHCVNEIDEALKRK